jgi:phage gpG-like protein
MAATYIKLTAVNGKEVRAKFRKLSEMARGELLSETLWAMGLMVEAYAKINITNLNLIKTGNLRASIHPSSPDVDPVRARGSISIGTNVVYAAIHEYGGFIRPIHAKMLIWTGKDGKTHAAHVVHMPAKPYLRPAVSEHITDLELTAAKTVNGQFYKWAGK